MGESCREVERVLVQHITELQQWKSIVFFSVHTETSFKTTVQERQQESKCFCLGVQSQNVMCAAFFSHKQRQQLTAPTQFIVLLLFLFLPNISNAKKTYAKKTPQL